MDEHDIKPGDPADYGKLPVDSQDARIVRWIRWLTLVPLAASGLLVAVIPQLRDSLSSGIQLLVAGDMPGLQRWTDDLGPGAMLVTGFLMVAQGIVAPLPAVLVTAANSFLLGPFWGGLYSVVTANLAATICYGIGRGFGSGVVHRLISDESMQRTRGYFHRHGATTVFAARLIPVVPFDPVSYLAGILGMKFWPFFWATLLGQLPAGMAYSYLVQNVAEPRMESIYVVCSLLAAAALAGHLLLRHGKPPDASRNNG